MQTRTTLQTRITATLLLNGFKPREILQFKPPIQQVITTIRRKVGVAPFAGGRPVSTPADPERTITNLSRLNGYALHVTACAA